MAHAFGAFGGGGWLRPVPPFRDRPTSSVCLPSKERRVAIELVGCTLRPCRIPQSIHRVLEAGLQVMVEAVGPEENFSTVNSKARPSPLCRNAVAEPHEARGPHRARRRLLRASMKIDAKTMSPSRAPMSPVASQTRCCGLKAGFRVGRGHSRAGCRPCGRWATSLGGSVMWRIADGGNGERSKVSF